MAEKHGLNTSSTPLLRERKSSTPNGEAGESPVQVVLRSRLVFFVISASTDIK
jgi:hypothetical protein